MTRQSGAGHARCLHGSCHTDNALADAANNTCAAVSARARCGRGQVAYLQTPGRTSFWAAAKLSGAFPGFCQGERKKSRGDGSGREKILVGLAARARAGRPGAWARQSKGKENLNPTRSPAPTSSAQRCSLSRALLAVCVRAISCSGSANPKRDNDAPACPPLPSLWSATPVTATRRNAVHTDRGDLRWGGCTAGHARPAHTSLSLHFQSCAQKIRRDGLD